MPRILLTVVIAVVLAAVGCTDDEAPPWGGGIPGGKKPVPKTPDASLKADSKAASDGSADGTTSPDGGAADAGVGCSAASPGTITVTGGSINGTLLTGSAPGVTVAAGALLSGTITVSIARADSCSACTFSMIITSNWQSPLTAYNCEGAIPSGTNTRIINVSKTAPSQAGEYYLIVAGRLDHSCDEVASASTGTLSWSDGNDIALWGSAAITEATGKGVACVDWTTASGASKALVPAAAVKITVQ
jgi:hypothetical protein